MKANCPSCGAEVQFKSSISVFAVCPFCTSMIVRHDMDLEALGKMAQLPEDLSPIKIGSRGKYAGTHFEVVGRLKVAWSEGYWNEWFIMFEDGKPAWLAEAMGFFMISSEVTEIDKLPPLKILKVGKGYSIIPQKTFFVDDIKTTTCIGSEGELPFSGLKGRKATSVDLGTNAGEFANLEYSDQDGVKLYVGKYVEFDSLDWSNLRDLEAEVKKVRSSSGFKCPSCGGPVSMLAPGNTASIACSYCGTIIDTTNEQFAILQEAEKKMVSKPLIPIGKKGRLAGGEWEVVGYMRRADHKGEYAWDEYLLFSPTRGFRWLTTYNGHWNFVEMLRVRPRISNDKTASLGGKTYKKFSEGRAGVRYVLGEFYWRVKVSDLAGVADYIAPPEILSGEGDGSEMVWSRGIYIEPEDIRKAFVLSENMPPKVGVAPNQPSPYGHCKTVGWVYLLFVMLLTVMQIYFTATAPAKQVFQGTFEFIPSRPIVTPAFDLPGDSANLSVDLYSPVDNNWVEVAVDLVDEKTGKSIEFTEGVEYYSGSDSDGPWTEGSKNKDLILSSVPGGKYHMVIQPNAPGAIPNKVFKITLSRGVSVWSNFFIAFMLLSIYPLCIWCRGRAFEVRRWSESDMSPYESSEDDSSDE